MPRAYAPTPRPDVLTFLCGHCSTELSVPVELSGIEGPCPSCGARLRAPELPPSPYYGQHWNSRNRNGLGDQAPPAALDYGQLASSEIGEAAHADPDHEEDRAEALRPRGMEWRSVSNFSAKLAIPGGDADDISPPSKRKDKSRALRRKLRKMDRMANVVLESPFYRIGRVVLLLVLGGSAGGLYLYLKNNKWMLKRPPVSTEVTAPALPRHPAAATQTGGFPAPLPAARAPSP